MWCDLVLLLRMQGRSSRSTKARLHQTESRSIEAPRAPENFVVGMRARKTALLLARGTRCLWQAVATKDVGDWRHGVTTAYEGETS